MTLDEFLEHAAQSDRPADGLAETLQSLWYAEKGNWENAHQIAQDIPTPDGSWVHAYLHREEGDDGNAGYWYSRANKIPSTLGLAEERHAIIKTLLQHEK
jgi:hypothetical protein